MITTALLITITEIIGACAGVIGVGIAVYLQLISRRHPPPRYVVAFFLGGVVMLLLHPEFVVPGALAWANDGLRLFGAVAAILLELALAVHVWTHYRIESPAELLSDAFDGDVSR